MYVFRCMCVYSSMYACMCVCEHVCSDNNHSCHSQQYYPLPLRQGSHGPGAYQLGMNFPVLASSELGLQVGTTTSVMFDFWGSEFRCSACKKSPLPAEPQLPILYNGNNAGLSRGVGIIRVKCWTLNWFSVQSGESIRTL